MTNGKKTLVIGHRGLSGVDCMAWNGSEVTNIVDYELCVIDQSSLTVSDLENVKADRIGKIKSLVSRLIGSRGQLVVIYDQNLQTKFGDSFDWSPISFYFHSESGNSLSVSPSPSQDYLAKFKEWNRFLVEAKPEPSLRSILGNSTSKINVVVEPLMSNRELRSLAFDLKFEVFHRRRSGGYSPSDYYEDTPDLVYGGVTVLPRITHLTPDESIRVFLSGCLGITQTTALPDWANAIKLPGMAEVDAEIAAQQKLIQNAEQRIEMAAAGKESIEKLLKLVIASGPELENAVAAAFADLGAVVKPAKYSQEEFIVLWKDQEYLFEVKGVSKSIALTHVRQLVDYMLKYQEDTGKLCKAVLFGNAWRDQPLERRGLDETPIFPDNVVEAAKRQHLGLLSSTTFFESYCEFKSGRLDSESILDTIFAAEAVIIIKPDPQVS